MTVINVMPTHGEAIDKTQRVLTNKYHLYLFYVY